MFSGTITAAKLRLSNDKNKHLVVKKDVSAKVYARITLIFLYRYAHIQRKCVILQPNL